MFTPAVSLHFRLVLVVLLQLSLLTCAANAAAEEVKGGESETQPKQYQQCGVYLAPSTIPGAGLGMFAGNKVFEIDDMVTDGDLVIPVYELDWHNGHKSFPFLWDEYVWSAGMFDGMDQEVEDIDTLHACSGGMGAAVNCMLPLVNVQDEDDSYTVSMSGVSSSSPGAGAFTIYHGRKFLATKRIEKGTELYASYGENYFSSRSKYDFVPLRRTYRNADRVLKKFQWMFVGKHEKQNTTSTATEALKTALWDLVIDFAKVMGEKRTLTALPTNHTNLQKILDSGGTAKVHYNDSIQSLEWLEEHGQCMDNIKDGISTIPHAGRGAFANRFIPEGGLVAPAPLVQLPNRRILVMYDGAEDAEGHLTRDLKKPIHKQLLLNYCFGHKSTTLLLCPYGLLTALINHGSGEKANAKIQWSKTMRHEEWMNMSIKEFQHVWHTGLSFDFVATRDIQEDEEILIDYGSEWERAWQRHLQKWGGEPPREGYTPGFALNHILDLQIQTMDEYDYDFEGVHMYCMNWYIERDGLAPLQDDDESVDYSPCRVLKRNHDDSYVVELWDVELGDFQRVKDHDVLGIMFDVPRDAFYFMDSPYTRDHHQTWSFRHDMRIPDEMIPEAWKNLPSRDKPKSTPPPTTKPAAEL